MNTAGPIQGREQVRFPPMSGPWQKKKKTGTKTGGRGWARGRARRRGGKKPGMALCPGPGGKRKATLNRPPGAPQGGGQPRHGTSLVRVVWAAVHGTKGSAGAQRRSRRLLHKRQQARFRESLPASCWGGGRKKRGTFSIDNRGGHVRLAPSGGMFARPGAGVQGGARYVWPPRHTQGRALPRGAGAHTGQRVGHQKTGRPRGRRRAPRSPTDDGTLSQKASPTGVLLRGRGPQHVRWRGNLKNPQVFT